MNKKLFEFLGLFFLIGSVSAGTMGDNNKCLDASCMPLFLELGTGASFSNNSVINYQPQYNVWYAPTTTYNSSLGTVPLFMAGIGWTVSPLLKIDASYSFRGMYRYNNHLDFTQIPSNTKYFNLTSNSLMFSGTLYAKGLENTHPELANHLVKEIDGYGYIQPMIGGGIGVSYNTVTNFHTIFDGTEYNDAAVQDTSIASFAWQLNAGVDWQMTDRFSFDIGYRYFNAGRFNSGDALYVRATPSGTVLNPKWIPAWISNLSANEIFFTGKYAF